MFSQIIFQDSSHTHTHTHTHTNTHTLFHQSPSH